MKTATLYTRWGGIRKSVLLRTSSLVAITLTTPSQCAPPGLDSLNEHVPPLPWPRSCPHLLISDDKFLRKSDPPCVSSKPPHCSPPTLYVMQLHKERTLRVYLSMTGCVSLHWFSEQMLNHAIFSDDKRTGPESLPDSGVPIVKFRSIATREHLLCPSGCL